MSSPVNLSGIILSTLSTIQQEFHYHCVIYLCEDLQSLTTPISETRVLINIKAG